MESFEQDRAKAQIFCIFRRSFNFFRAGDEYASFYRLPQGKAGKHVTSGQLLVVVRVTH